MNPLLTAVIGSAVRWLITIAAAQGVALSEDMATQIASGLIALTMLAWSWLQKQQQDRAVKEAAHTGIVP